MIGQLISHYRVLEKIAAGGMGEVYLGEDTELGRQVALKFLPAGSEPDAAVLERFRREARAAAALDHPNIVTVHEVGEHDGRPFIVMSYVRGVTLTAKIREGHLSVEHALRYAIQIAEGLAHAHQAGIVHRDIKPDNILVDHDDRPRLLDFGLARLEGVTRLTRESSTLGTIYYMSPEQARGEETDERADLYSLGVVIYEMLTGRVPFDGDNAAAVLNAIATQQPEPLARYTRQPSPEIERIVAKAMAKSADERYRSANDLLSDLRRETRLSDTTLTGARAAKAPRRSLLLPVLGGLAVIAAILLYMLVPRASEPADEGGSTLAIMYFDNMTDPGDEQRLGEILTNLMITDLSEAEGLSVLSSQRLYDLLKLEGKEGVRSLDRETSTAVAKRAGARWMLLGSILQTEPQFVVTSQVVEVASGEIESSQRVSSRAGEDLFAVGELLLQELHSDLTATNSSTAIADSPGVRYTNSEDAYRYYLEGQELANRYEWILARESFRSALEADSTFAMAAFELARNRSIPREQQIVYGQQAMRFSAKLGNRDRMFVEQLMARLQGYEERCREILREMTRRFPDDKEVYYQLGRETHFVDPKAAIPLLLRSIEIDPMFKLAYNQLAYSYALTNDLERAIEAIDRYIELAPGEFNPYDSRAEIYAMFGMFDEAIESYRIAADMGPDSAYSRAQLAVLLAYEGDYERAEDEFRRLMTSSADFMRSTGRFGLAAVSLHRGKLKESLRRLQQAIAADRIEEFRGEEYFDKLIVLAQIHELSGEPDLAVAALSELPLYAEGSKSGWDPVFCELYAERGDAASAQRALDALEANIEGEHIDVLENARGWTAFAHGRFEQAAQHFARAAVVERNMWNLRPRALSLLRAGRHSEAVEAFDIALRTVDYSWFIDPMGSTTMLYHAATAFEGIGSNDRAIELYEKFLWRWENGDDALPYVQDARDRLDRLRTRP